jgi:hypothetical protein
VGLIDEKTEGQKSHATVPLKADFPLQRLNFTLYYIFYVRNAPAYNNFLDREPSRMANQVIVLKLILIIKK